MRRPNNFVFVNCPFDDQYLPMRRATFFTILSCDFVPRCALETIDSGMVRFDKICSLVKECRFGVHDLSRTELNNRGLPRFNMPFELGLFLGCQRFGGTAQQRKCTLILDREPYRYQEFISDIAGMDPESHDGRPEGAVKKVRHWLRPHTNEALAGPAHIWEQLQNYEFDLPDLCNGVSQHPDHLSFIDEIVLMRHWLKLARAAKLD